MGKTLTLDDLNGMVEEAYGPLVLTGLPGGGDINLLPIMRLSREKRAKFSDAVKTMSAKEEAAGGDINASIDSVVELLGLVCEKAGDIARIKKSLGDDGQKLLTLWQQYQEVTKLGEASGSQS